MFLYKKPKTFADIGNLNPIPAPDLQHKILLDIAGSTSRFPRKVPFALRESQNLFCVSTAASETVPEPVMARAFHRYECRIAARKFLPDKFLILHWEYVVFGSPYYLNRFRHTTQPIIMKFRKPANQTFIPSSLFRVTLVSIRTPFNTINNRCVHKHQTVSACTSCHWIVRRGAADKLIASAHSIRQELNGQILFTPI